MELPCAVDVEHIGDRVVLTDHGRDTDPLPDL